MSTKTKTRKTTKNRKPAVDVYKLLTDEIIAALEEGIVPWHRPWKVTGLPMSLSTNRPYRGINAFWLSVQAQLQGYGSQWWGTYNQISERGGQVRKGERGTVVVLWKRVSKTERDEQTGEEKDGSYMLLRHFKVFNAEQADGLDLPQPEMIEHDEIADAHEIAIRWQANGGPRVEHGGDRASYSPLLDQVRMPMLNAFDTAEHYYGTLFHEHVHSTGHKDRLGRPSLVDPKPFGSEDYSREELVAEMGAAFLCAEAGIEPNIQHHASYIGSWLQMLRDDHKLVVQAAAQAQKAADLILGRKWETPAEEKPETEEVTA